MRKRLLSLTCVFLVSALTVFSQSNATRPDSPKYEQLKKEGKLNFKKVMQSETISPGKKILHPKISERRLQGTNHPMSFHAQCGCLLPLDSAFQVVPFTNGTPPEYRNDDGSSPLISLPFYFNFYGQQYNAVYINNNGNITFNNAVFSYTAGGFPAGADTVMVAPFWGDVDTRAAGSGLVYYKITPTAMIVKWDSVGYYGQHDDLLNTFQLIITDGTDPILPPGNNVDFCYGNMSWTTGDASQGSGGYGGVPATVGANAGNALDYIQFGRFDEPGYGYDGPFGANDSVDFLDYQNFIFNTNTSGGASNIPPIVHGLVVCDTIVICADDTAFADTIPVSLDFLSPEQGQITTITTNFTGPGHFTVLNNTSGPSAHIDAQIILNSTSVGVNSATFIATDNGTPPATDSLNVTFKIDTFPLAPPLVTGSHYYCIGGTGVRLQVQTGFQTYLWSTGTMGTDTLDVLTGTYNVEVTDANGCRSKSNAFPVWEVNPNPIIAGVTAVCGQGNAHLITTQHYSAYHWSNGATADSINVGSGTYTVTVTDSLGCTATSAPLTVNISSNPNANFAYSPLNGLPGDTIHFFDMSSANTGTSIVGWLWNFGDNTTSTAQNPTHIYTTLASFPVSLTVTQSDGCTRTITLTYTGEPNEVIVPNVFSPNGDGFNQTFSITNLEFYPNSSLKVFNRWGRKVYESNDYKNDWDGGDLADGVYYYVLKRPEKDVLKGTVTIMKNR